MLNPLLYLVTFFTFNLPSILVNCSHCVFLSHQQRNVFTPHLPSLTFAWMHFTPWRVLTHHYGWGRKRGLLKWMVPKLFAFHSIKKSLQAALASTGWHLYHIMVHGSFWGCLEQIYQRYLSKPRPVLYLSIAAFNSSLAKEGKKGVFTTPWRFKQLQYQQKAKVNILWYWSVTH